MINPFIFNEDILKKVEDDISICRYLTFEKLQTLIGGELYFRRVDKYPDHTLEGTWPNKDRQFLEEINLDVKPIPSKKYAAVSCWSVGQEESKRMWCAFAMPEDSVMIKSSHKKLRSSILNNEENIKSYLKQLEQKEGCSSYGMYSGLVEYIDYDTMSRIRETKGNGITIKHIDGPLPYRLIKNKYKFQEEYRALITFSENKVQYIMGSKPKKYNPIPEDDIKLPIKIEELIEEVRFHPNATEENKQKIRALLNEKNIKVVDSDLDSWKK